MTYRSISGLAVALTTLAFAAACSDNNDNGTNPTPQTAHVRVVNLLSSATNAGLFANGTQVGSNVAFGSAGASCVNVPVGQGLSFRSAGSSTDLTTGSNTALAANQNYTVVLYGTSTAPHMAILSDANITAPSAGNNALRIFNGTATAGDVFVTAPNGATTGTASVANLGAGQSTTGTSMFGSYPTANTQIRLYNTGTSSGTPRVNTTFSSTNLSSSRVGTAFLTESNMTGGTTNASVVTAPCS